VILLPPLLIAVILGLVEGATEFLPISSTGHLIAVGSFLSYTGDQAGTFEVVIQFGAILAVIWHFRASLVRMAAGVFRPGPDRETAINLAIAFLPAVVIGLLAHEFIKTVLFSPSVVAVALIIGGVIMLVIEWWRPVTTAESIEGMGRGQALIIGFAQVLAMVPGTSRAAATILGGYGAGLSRPAATEFSFLLAIPTIVGAASLDLLANRDLLGREDLPMFAVGTFVAFVSALMVIRVFLRFVERHTFKAFAWYRIGFGLLLVVLLARGVI
jgi:undecaprenyl-diphosphatase